MNNFVYIGFGIVSGLGFWLLILGLRNKSVIDLSGLKSLNVHKAKTLQEKSKTNLKRVGFGVVVGGAVWLFTGIFVAGLLLGVGIGLFKGRLGSKREMLQVTERSEAIASWTEMLYSILLAGGGIEKAISTSASLAPKAIKSEVIKLAERLENHPIQEALRSFAEEMRHPASDKIVAALILSATRGAQDLVDLLRSQVESTRADNRIVLQLEAGRSRHRTSAIIVMVVTLTVAGGLYFLEEGYLDPYRSFPGYLVLVFVGLGFMLGFGLLIRMGTESSPERYFDFSQNQMSGGQLRRSHFRSPAL